MPDELKTYRFTIPGRLPGLNDWIDAMNLHRQNGAKFKAAAQETVMWEIYRQLGARKTQHPVFLKFTWIEKDRRRDRDNVSSFGRKVIQDALVCCGTLQDDGWDYVTGYSDDFAIDKGNPRIEVEIIEREGIVKCKDAKTSVKRAKKKR